MQVGNAMNPSVLTIGADHTLRDAARAMASRRVGAAVVVDPDGEGAGILTERDILLAIADGDDPDHARAADHLTPEIVYAAPQWTLEEAAEAMMRGGFRHLVVLDAGEVSGIISVRDIVRHWHADRTSAQVNA